MPDRAQPVWLKWSSDRFRAEERFDAWQEALNASHLRWRLTDRPTAEFAAEVEICHQRNLSLVRCACQPCSGHRGSQEIAAANSGHYGLLLVYDGREEVRIGSESVLLGPATSLLWDSTAPIRFKLHTAIRKITAFVPHQRLEEVLPEARRLVGVGIDWHRGLGAVAASHLAALGSRDDDQAHSAAEATLELIAAGLGGQRAHSANPCRRQLLSKIKRHIDSHLADPDLKAQGLADCFGISLRYLYLLFAEEGDTVSR
jgi:hypothetical protein